MATAINRKFFFSQITHSLVGGKLTQKFVEGAGALLDYWERSHAQEDDRWLAYALATAFHETAATMQPIKEYGGDKYFHKMYDIQGARPAVAKRLGNLTPGDGKKFPGRGYVQLTGKTNYQKWTVKLNMSGVNLVTNPEKAMDPKIASAILFEGMIEGSFTSRRLNQYFNKQTTDWVGARAIINGKDRAQMIAIYGQKFYASISYTT
jgi:putative chitinase